MHTNDLISKARNEIGVCEVPANSNNVKYNTWFYGKNVEGTKYPWCCAFISWLFKSEPKLCKRTASCADLLDWFEKNGRITPEPKPGDIVFFKFSTNNRKANHVGLVIGSGPHMIRTIEGNTSQKSDDNGGKVMIRERQRNNLIVAYARPEYVDADKIPVKIEKKPVDVIVQEVIEGKWGSGNNRKTKLNLAGYDYQEIQDKVNAKLKEEKT